MGRRIVSFSKSEKLKSKKKIEELFKKGSSFYLKSFSLRFIPAESDVSVHQVLISVPKRNFKRAVDRNLIKRRIREAYRLNKHLVNECKPHSIGFIYLSKEILTFHEIQDQLIEGMNRFKNKYVD